MLSGGISYENGIAVSRETPLNMEFRVGSLGFRVRDNELL
jgi:hypothetical protein